MAPPRNPRANRSTEPAGIEAPTLPGLEPDSAAEPGPDSDPGRDPDEAAGGAVPPHYVGHRDRLRQRFLASAGEGLQDYELLELLLFSAVPRRDVKPLAKALLAEFGTLWGVVTASPNRLRKTFNFSDGPIATLTVVGAAALRATRSQVMNRPVLAGWEALLDYCRAAMAHETTEQLRLLFLDRKNTLVGEEVHQRGTIDHTPAYPREIVRRALEVGAHAVILVHNHPTGDPNPSRDDIFLTNEVKRAATAVGLVLHDHLIVTRSQTTSLKALGVM